MLALAYGDSFERQIYRNSTDKISATRRTYNALSNAFIVNEDWVDVDWEIKKKQMIVAYHAIMAMGIFRGRDYTVWFALDIPVPFEPWKLHGLPGLILEATDNEKTVCFYAVEIIIPYDSISIISLPTAENHFSHQEEVYIEDNFNAFWLKN
jgi:GLPGLI family protein